MTNDLTNSRGVVGTWRAIPLYLRIVVGAGLGVLLGLALGPDAAPLQAAGGLLLRVLGALAAPLILLAVVQAILTTEVKGRTGLALFYLLFTNTLAAIAIGLFVANTLQPGAGADLTPPKESPLKDDRNIVEQLLENVPRSIAGPFTDGGSIIGVVILALLFGLALRRMRGDPRIQAVKDFLDLALGVLIIVLHWVVDLLPFAVLAIVAAIVGKEGFASFQALGWFVVAVLAALLLQVLFYLTRIRLGSWARPWHVLRGVRDALVMAFSTASSTVTMPVTYDRLQTRVGLRQQSASMGAMVGANFNNDGTALYEAMAALFVSQLIGVELSLVEQGQVVLLSVVASVGAAGIPEAGLVTMVLVFKTVGLPPEYIGMLLPIDWFLDRCRTAVNVMGDVTVSCLLDGRTRDPNINVTPISTDVPALDAPVEH
ncbi:MAG: dicarboxylate/amino acid:cation symporter [Pirellulales bacterium]